MAVYLSSENAYCTSSRFIVVVVAAVVIYNVKGLGRTVLDM